MWLHRYVVWARLKSAGLMFERVRDTSCVVRGTAVARVRGKAGALEATVACGREELRVLVLWEG